ncbi:hypothetical protein ACFSTH_02600 [Paenibacillus yanchengensis]|uniref:WYL domain-containing protein n=1 Tax=Paenibacillus yanchengensis TaxID=2035833 RepID=A0ABW4YGH1_9BACL
MDNYIGQIYIDRKRQVTIRKVKVLSVKDKRMKAYCYTANSFRIFSIPNIVDVELISHAG